MSEAQCTRSACEFDGCVRQSRVRGFCVKHYHAMRHLGKLPPLVCKQPGCETVAYGRGKGYCGDHYARPAAPPCAAEGCGRPAHARGYCSTHLQRLKKYGDPHKTVKKPNGAVKGRPCSVPACELGATTTAGGQVYCDTHYSRIRSHGDPHTVIRPQRNSPEDKKANAAARHRRYHATPHGKMRQRFNAAKVRAMKHGCDWATGIPKDVFLALYAATHCALCGNPFLPDETKCIDHIIPLSKGGPNSPDNLQMVHGPCNSRKNNRMARLPCGSS